MKTVSCFLVNDTLEKITILCSVKAGKIQLPSSNKDGLLDAEVAVKACFNDCGIISIPQFRCSKYVEGENSVVFCKMLDSVDSSNYGLRWLSISEMKALFKEDQNSIDFEFINNSYKYFKSQEMF